MPTSLTQYVRTWWKHTPKAIRRGEPADRLFAVVDVQTGRDRGLVAWKCRDCGNGMIVHPAYGREPVALADIDPFVRHGITTISEPSALFVPDSLYVLCGGNVVE